MSDVNVVGMPEFDSLLDHIYEYGTAAEGVVERANAFARAVIARYTPPEGYVLISEEVLRVWGKLDEVRECCRYPKHTTPRHAITFCDNCGCSWLDDGLNPIGCPYCKQAAAVAAIQFALNDPEGMTFLRLWNEGEFDTIRREWPDAPSVVYVGADPLAAKRQENRNG